MKSQRKTVHSWIKYATQIKTCQVPNYASHWSSIYLEGPFWSHKLPLGFYSFTINSIFFVDLSNAKDHNRVETRKKKSAVVLHYPSVLLPGILVGLFLSHTILWLSHHSIPNSTHETTHCTQSILVKEDSPLPRNPNSPASDSAQTLATDNFIYQSKPIAGRVPSVSSADSPAIWGTRLT